MVGEEPWQAVDEHAEIVTKSAQQAWISSRPLQAANVPERCHLAARYRRGIESGFLVEKHQGYADEHAFAKDWNAMRGYHSLMRLAHLLNTLARFSSTLAPLMRQWGVRPFIALLRTTLSGPWFDQIGLDEIARRLGSPFQLRLI